MASGSEVELAYKASLELLKLGIQTQVIPVPILQNLINNKSLVKDLSIDRKPILAIEATSDSMWYQLSKYNKVDAILAINGYGYSALGDKVYALKGFSVKNVINKVQEMFKL